MKTEILRKNTKKSIKNIKIDLEVDTDPDQIDEITVKIHGLHQNLKIDHLQTNQ